GDRDQRPFGSTPPLPASGWVGIPPRGRRTDVRAGDPRRDLLPALPAAADVGWRELPVDLQSGVQPGPRTGPRVHRAVARRVLNCTLKVRIPDPTAQQQDRADDEHAGDGDEHQRKREAELLHIPLIRCSWVMAIFGGCSPMKTNAPTGAFVP